MAIVGAFNFAPEMFGKMLEKEKKLQSIESLAKMENYPANGFT